MRWIALFVSALAWPRRLQPMVSDWIGHCGHGQLLCGNSTAPSPNWQPGHRGVDLAGTPGQLVFAAADGTVVFAGQLAGRPVVSIAHPGGLRTTYEPVVASVRAGRRVDAGTVLGELQAGHIGCTATACLHWGAMWGPASRADYVDPLGLLASTPIRLKPVG